MCQSYYHHSPSSLYMKHQNLLARDDFQKTPDPGEDSKRVTVCKIIYCIFVPEVPLNMVVFLVNLLHTHIIPSFPIVHIISEFNTIWRDEIEVE